MTRVRGRYRRGQGRARRSYYRHRRGSRPQGNLLLWIIVAGGLFLLLLIAVNS